MFEAYIFVNGTQHSKLLPNTSESLEFGTSLAINDEKLIVATGYLRRGVVLIYYYALQSGSKVPVFKKMLEVGPGTEDIYGGSCSLDIDKNVLVVGLDEEEPNSVYIYDLDDPDLFKMQKLASNVPNDLYGWDVAVSDDIVVVGARDDNDQKGAMYLYSRVHDAHEWDLDQIIYNPVATTDRVGFGFSVDVSGLFIVVNAQFENSVFIYEKNQR